MEKLQQSNTPNWSRLLVEAVNKPGLVMSAYTAFHNYSLGNQVLALFQCHERGLKPGPLDTYPGWQRKGRSVKRGEKALTLCMPITCKRNAEDNKDDDDARLITAFVYKPRWFVLDQTEGEDIELPTLPKWKVKLALAELDIEMIPFEHMDGNCQGYARKRQTAINPVAQLPEKTLFHELAHCVLGHTAEADFTDTERTPKSLREVEAEAVALLCCESLGLEGATFCRGYIQHWLEQGGADDSSIPEKSAQKIFRAADQILKAGRMDQEISRIISSGTASIQD
jgi:hypothetical protein